MSTHSWNKIKAEMTPERRTRLDAEVLRDVLAMGPWFPNGVVPTNRQVVYAFLSLPYHIRWRIVDKLAIGFSPTFVDDLHWVYDNNKMLEFMEMIRDATQELNR